jgi:hypothetical protein
VAFILGVVTCQKISFVWLQIAIFFVEEGLHEAGTFRIDQQIRTNYSSVIIVEQRRQKLWCNFGIFVRTSLTHGRRLPWSKNCLIFPADLHQVIRLVVAKFELFST